MSSRQWSPPSQPCPPVTAVPTPVSSPHAISVPPVSSAAPSVPSLPSAVSPRAVSPQGQVSPCQAQGAVAENPLQILLHPPQKHSEDKPLQPVLGQKVGP